MFLLTMKNAHRDLDVITAEMVREYIQRRNKSQKWLAERAGVSSTTINYWMAGKTRPTERTRLKIAVAMGIADPILLDDLEPEPSGATMAKGNGVKA